MTWVSDIFRWLFFLIDKIVYSLITTVYNLFMEIATTTFFTEEVLGMFSSKVYALVGVFMLFKVSFSVLTYIVNPDEFSDKSKGMGKMVSNIVISLVLLIAVPFVFSKAMQFQSIVLRDDIIPKIFSTENMNLSSSSDQGSNISNITFSTFFFENNSERGLPNNSGLFSRDVNEKVNDQYRYHYDYFISTAVGVVIVLILVSFCFDIALRNIKLGFLQMLAPIPIISRVDPKKGTEVFSKWVKLSLSVYLDLFFRLIAIFFAIFVIKCMQNAEFVDSVTGASVTPSGLTAVFIILGALMFAKQLPKLIEDLTGIKLSGSFTLNPLKKLEEVPVAGKPIAAVSRFAGRTTLGVAGLAGNLAARGIDNLTGNKISGTFGGAINRVKQDIQTFKDLASDVMASNQTTSQIAETGRGIANDAAATLNEALAGIPGAANLLSKAAEHFEKQIKEFDSITTNIDSIFTKAGKEMIKHEEMQFKDSKGDSTNMREFKLQQQLLESLKSKDTSGMSESELRNHLEKLNDTQTYVAKTEKLAQQAFVDSVKSGVYSDAEISARLDNVTQTVTRSTNTIVRGINVTTGAGLKDGNDAVSDEKIRVQSSDEYRRAQNRKNAAPKK